MAGELDLERERETRRAGSALGDEREPAERDLERRSLLLLLLLAVTAGTGERLFEWFERDLDLERDLLRSLGFDPPREREWLRERDLLRDLVPPRERERLLERDLLRDFEPRRDRDRLLERDLLRDLEPAPRERERLRLLPRRRVLSSSRRIRRPCRSAPSSFSIAVFMSLFDAKSTIPMFLSRLWASA